MTSITPDYLSSKLISSDEFVPFMYNIIRIAGKEATRSEAVKNNIHNVCVIPQNSPRRKPCSTKSNDRYTLTYDDNDIMIVGGVVLNLYDRLISKKQNNTRRIETLKEFLRRETLDIDMKWWPRVKTPDGTIITAFSEALQTLVDEFKKTLDATLIEKKNDIFNKVSTALEKKFPLNSYDIDSFEIITDRIPRRMGGYETVSIYFKIKSILIKICEISIYDGGNSQEFNLKGEKFNNIQSMSTDIYYSMPISMTKPSTYKTLQNINIDGIDIAIPSLIHYIIQQLFTFFIQTKDTGGEISSSKIEKAKKGINSYKRVFFIRELLSQFKSDSEFNKNIFSKYVIGLPDFIKTQKKLILWITVNIYEIFNKNKEILNIICEDLSSSNNEGDVATKFMCDNIRAMKRININKTSGISGALYNTSVKNYPMSVYAADKLNGSPFTLFGPKNTTLKSKDLPVVKLVPHPYKPKTMIFEHNYPKIVRDTENRMYPSIGRGYTSRHIKKYKNKQGKNNTRKNNRG